jgi:hypothetical protein
MTNPATQQQAKAVPTPETTACAGCRVEYSDDRAHHGAKKISPGSKRWSKRRRSKTYPERLVPHFALIAAPDSPLARGGRAIQVDRLESFPLSSVAKIWRPGDPQIARRVGGCVPALGAGLPTRPSTIMQIELRGGRSC